MSFPYRQDHFLKFCVTGLIAVFAPDIAMFLEIISGEFCTGTDIEDGLSDTADFMLLETFALWTMLCSRFSRPFRPATT